MNIMFPAWAGNLGALSRLHQKVLAFGRKSHGLKVRDKRSDSVYDLLLHDFLAFRLQSFQTAQSTIGMNTYGKSNDSMETDDTSLFV
jgi:hypothetical protein